MTDRVRVVAALLGELEHPGRYLVQQRPLGKSRALLWEFPGGKVEPGEADETTLRRECLEELGVALDVGGCLWANTHEYADLTVELVLYEATIGAGMPSALEGQHLRYVTPEQMRALPFCEADLPLVEALLAGLAGRAREKP